VAQEFLYDVCARLAARDAVRVFQLKIGSGIVASRLGLADAPRNQQRQPQHESGQ
jgi:hypothetical protein